MPPIWVLPCEKERIPGKKYVIALCDTMLEAKRVIEQLKNEVPRVWYEPEIESKIIYIVTAKSGREE
jgi:hypothetical protein